MRKEAKKHVKHYRAFTLVELILVVGTIALVAGVLVGLVQNSYKDFMLGSNRSTLLQDGQSATEQMIRILRQATTFSAVSESTDAAGYVTFTDANGIAKEFRLNTVTSELEFGEPGSLSALTDSVNSLVFTCYDIYGDVLAGSVPADSIQSVQIEVALSSGNDSFTLSGRVFCHTDFSNLVGWWKLDETSGLTATDSSGFGNDCTLTYMTGNEWTTGIMDGALELDGNNDYLVRSSTSSLNLPTAWTISVWVSFVGSPAYEYIVTKNTRNTGDMEYGIYVRNPASGGAIGVVLDGTIIDIGSVAWSMQTWTHIAVTWDGSDARAYVDGGFVDSIAYSGPLTNNGNWFNIGRRSNSTDGTNSTGLFDGFIDDVRVYNRALDPAEIADLANIIRYWEFTDAKTGSNVQSLTITTPTTNEGDLLIAAVATDGSTSSSLAPPGGEGWTKIDADNYNGEVTLGAWWKLADASESSSHQFTWSGGQHAYGWIMRFTGHDPDDPINNYSTNGESSSTPTSPAVTTTFNNCMILRLGAFDDDDITVGDPGLPGHTAITMDKTAIAPFQDGFETSLDLWTDGGDTDWDRTTSQQHSGSYSAHAGSLDNDLISDNIDTSSYSSFTIDFWYMDDDIDDQDNVFLQLYDGSSYDNRFELDMPWNEEDIWQNYNETIYDSGGDAQYFKANFRIKFEATYINNWKENIWIDDVTVTTIGGGGTVSGGAGYVRQWTVGGSGTSTFTLGSSNQAQTLTIAIAPAL